MRTCNLDNYYLDGGSYLKLPHSFQMYFERMLYEQFYDYENSFNLYGPGYFWYENFTPIFHVYNVDGGHRIGYDSWRPFTGEEFRMYFWNALIFGAKGLFIDREYTEPFCYDCGENNNEHKFGVAGLSWGSDYYWDNPLDKTDPETEWSVEDFSSNFRSKLLGGDFLNITSNSNYHLNYESVLTAKYPQSNITDYINLSEQNGIPGINDIKSDRIYLGRATLRTEFKKFTDLINETTGTEDDLMNLQLEAALMHGYKIWYHQNPRFPACSTNSDVGENDENYRNTWVMSNFINTCGIKAKKLYQPEWSTIENKWILQPVTNFQNEDLNVRTFGDCNSAPVNEYFYNLTLLSHKDDPDMNHVFYIGVVNRACDPLIYDYDDYVDQHYMKFLSTAELEDLCQDGGIDPDRPNIQAAYRTAQEWQELHWKRLGCREITIPFAHATNQYMVERFPLLHISEVGSSSDLLALEPWRDPKYYDKIDVVIDTKKNLKVKLLPGEGKILKVEILPAAHGPGDLEFSNQTKLVSRPIILNDTIYQDSIYYHMVYHRRVNDTNRVFYRRSKIVSDTAPLLNNSNIIWEEPEMCLSDSVWVNCEETSHYHPDCAYPAIVVRPDGTGKNVAYVVFTCDYNTNLAVVENKLEADAAYPVPRDRPKIIATVNGRNKDVWGTPVINGSANGNFISWSDSTLGTGLGWQDTASSCLQTSCYVRYDVPGQRACTHPSLNSYSRPDENECALVWSEVNYTSQNPPYQSTHRLVYARPKYDGNYIYLDQFRTLNTPQGIAFNTSRTMAAIGNPVNADNKFPVVYRGLDEPSWQDKDRIAWQDMIDETVQCSGIPPIPAITTSINYLMVDTELRQGNDSSFFYPIKYLHAESISPNITNGKFWGYMNNLSDSAMIMEFSTLDPCDPYDTNGRKIWCVPHGFVSFLAADSYNMTQIQAMTHAVQLSGNGYMPHLAARASTDGESGWWKNRRVFMEADGSIGDTIISSPEIFYKGERKPIAIPFIGFVNNDNHSLVSPFMLDGELLGFDLADNFKIGCDTCISTRLPDTIQTKWFKVGNQSRLDLFAKGMDLNNVEMFVERKSNRQSSRINMVSMPDTILAPVNFALLNGSNNEYRILFKKRNNFNFYTEHLYFMPDPFSGGLLKRSEEGTILVDLGMTSNDNTDNNLRIYPNPAENVLYVTACNGMETKTRLKVRIYTSLSELIQEYEVNSCETASIPTASLPAGVFFVRAGNTTLKFIKM